LGRKHKKGITEQRMTGRHMMYAPAEFSDISEEENQESGAGWEKKRELGVKKDFGYTT